MTNENAFLHHNIDLSSCNTSFKTTLIDSSQHSKEQSLNHNLVALHSQFQKCVFMSSVHELCTKNPTHLTNAYWQYIISHDVSAYMLDEVLHLGIYDSFYPNCEHNPIWCMHRIGQSSTLLPDGREVLIGGEFEDGYNPYFAIYNDVMVKHPNGHVEIFGYPQHVFPPTDFHTATLVGDCIWIIGGLGYQDNRQYQHTPVYKLNIHTFKITQVETVNQMGWIYHHHAKYHDGQIIITGGKLAHDSDTPITEQFDTWALNLHTLIWQNITKKPWQCFYVGRQDYGYLHLWEYSLLESSGVVDMKNAVELEKQLGIPPDVATYKSLCIPPVEHIVDNSEMEYSETAIFIDSVRVRYVLSDDQTVQVYIEGELPKDTVDIVQENLKHKLEKIENMACMVKSI